MSNSLRAHGLSIKFSSRILEWVAYPFSSRSPWSRNRTRVSCIAGRFFTNWAIREAKTFEWDINNSKHLGRTLLQNTFGLLSVFHLICLTTLRKAGQLIISVLQMSKPKSKEAKLEVLNQWPWISWNHILKCLWLKGHFKALIVFSKESMIPKKV